MKASLESFYRTPHCSSACHMVVSVSLIVSANSNAVSILQCIMIWKNVLHLKLPFPWQDEYREPLLVLGWCRGKNGTVSQLFGGQFFQTTYLHRDQGDAATCPRSLSFINDRGGGVLKCPSVPKPGRFSCCSANLCMSRKAREWVMLKEEALLTDLTVQWALILRAFFKTCLNNSIFLFLIFRPSVSLVHLSLAFTIGLGQNFVLPHLVPCPPKTHRVLTLSPKLSFLT